MSAKIKRLQPKDKQAQLEIIQQLQLLFEQIPDLNEKKASALLWDLKRKNKLNDPNTWTFIMISPEQNRAVVQWLTTNSKRPLKALELWSILFENVHRETSQIMLSRQELAKELNILPRNVSTIMSELESIKAIIKQKEGRGVTYYMNPNVATHLNQEERDKARPTAPKLSLINGRK
ncbi:hypothetical protein [Commensalibacter nepenthis]|uniref:HTH crp-type domain-containing protein n=1 Tax=Commensalibacter nepenthis TaxID=3043872 RepID=A0ABT6QAK5_9PROT|nr:hypothetical protein [Commensalibacter sp. TBRC 10068]MDI2113927.1 hypothetical protein [Commensalibacter sp. TBRC 10068]